jgi:hypothetical protein
MLEAEAEAEEILLVLVVLGVAALEVSVVLERLALQTRVVVGAVLGVAAHTLVAQAALVL